MQSKSIEMSVKLEIRHDDNEFPDYNNVHPAQKKKVNCVKNHDFLCPGVPSTP